MFLVVAPYSKFVAVNTITLVLELMVAVYS